MDLSSVNSSLTAATGQVAGADRLPAQADRFRQGHRQALAWLDAP